MRRIPQKDHTVVLTDPVVYTDNKARNRSGHMTHAMTEFAPGCFIDFQSSCSPVRLRGHSAYGFAEYRISRDYGETYSEVKTLPYSWQALMDGMFTISVEKAVTCQDGSILAFCLRNTMLSEVCCEPWLTPVAVRSRDGGETWEEAFEVSPYKGRIYDAITLNGKIYFVQLNCDGFPGKNRETKYVLFVSEDDGKSFRELSRLPVDAVGRGYGALLWDGTLLHFYGCNIPQWKWMDHAVSRDFGKTWTVTEACFMEKGIRNCQLAYMEGVYLAHGRDGECTGFALYTSRDGQKWSKASYIGTRIGPCYYSNNLLLQKPGEKPFLLLQYSECWEDFDWGETGTACVDAMHRELRVEN